MNAFQFNALRNSTSNCFYDHNDSIFELNNCFASLGYDHIMMYVSKMSFIMLTSKNENLKAFLMVLPLN